jgi:hypothetical protein
MHFDRMADGGDCMGRAIEMRCLDRPFIFKKKGPGGNDVAKDDIRVTIPWNLGP